MITYQIEPWHMYYPECKALWQEHYDEFYPAHEGRMEMDPDVEAYRDLEKRGQLQILVARESGRMVGYCLILVRPHLHYKGTLCGFEDSYFITKSHRKGFVGIRLFQVSLAMLRARGVKRAFFMTKEFNSVARIFQRLGMTKIDSAYAIWL